MTRYRSGVCHCREESNNVKIAEDCLTHLLICPLCHLRFSKVGSTLKCASRHSFDLAKEGYANLVTHKLAASVGDSKEMLQARRNFLEHGHYQLLSSLLNELVISYLRQESSQESSNIENNEAGEILPHTVIVDVGCGEGYYLGQMQQQLTRAFSSDDFCLLGLDVAKDAIRMAAKRYKAVQFVVADLKAGLVCANDSVHVLLNIFAPRNIDEFARVLMPGGIALVVVPQPTHLQQLRSLFDLLSIEEQKEQHVIAQFLANTHFSLLTTRTLTYQLDLTQEEIVQAVTMTPGFRHLSEEARATMNAIQHVQTEVSFSVLMFQKWYS